MNKLWRNYRFFHSDIIRTFDNGRESDNSYVKVAADETSKFRM